MGHSTDMTSRRDLHRAWYPIESMPVSPAAEDETRENGLPRCAYSGVVDASLSELESATALGAADTPILPIGSPGDVVAVKVT